MTHSPNRATELAMTVAEVLAPAAAPVIVQSQVSRVLEHRGIAWGDVELVARVIPDEPRDGESWLIAVTAIGVRAGGRLLSEATWAYASRRYSARDGRTIHHINITDRVVACGVTRESSHPLPGPGGL